MLPKFIKFNVLKRLASTEAATSDALRLSFACPHQTICKDSIVKQVNLSTSDGSLGILARHAPSLYQLSPGRVDLISPDAATPVKSYFVSGGFVTVNPDSTMQIAAMEAVSLDQLDREVIANGLAEAQRKAAATANLPLTDQARAEASIHLEVYEALSSAMK